MRFYSDNGVDQTIHKLLPEVGFAADVGANNGEYISNTLHFEEKGWTVLCIEPNPLLASLGKSRRKLWVEAACGDHDEEEAELKIVGREPYASHTGLEMRYGFTEPYAIALVKVRTLDRLLEEAGFDHLDLLCVDVEGYEPEVMRGFTIERWKPKVMVIEHLEKTPEEPIPGYSVKGRLHHDDIYVRDE